MAIVSAEAIVLRSFPFGDTSRIAILLTRDQGKVRVLAKGARAPRSRIGPALDPFSEIQAVYYEKPSRELQLLKSADPLRLHPGFGEDPTRLAFGSAALELSDVGVSGEEAGPEFFELLSHVLELMEHADRGRLGMLLAAFELKVAAYMGYQAEFRVCRGCGHAVEGQGYFSPHQGAVLCAACARGTEGLERVSAGAAAWLRYLNAESSEEPAMREGDRSELREAARLIQLFLAAHLHNFRGLRSLEVLRRLEAAGAGGAVPERTSSPQEQR